MNASAWMPLRGGPRLTVRRGGRRELLRIAATLLGGAVQDLGKVRDDAGADRLARNWVALASLVLDLQDIFDFPSNGFRPTDEEVADWLRRVQKLRTVLRQPVELSPIERRLDVLLEQFEEMDWSDLTVWSGPFAPRRVS